MLRDLGPDFSYIPQPVNSVLVVDPSDMHMAQKLFGDLGLQIVSSH